MKLKPITESIIIQYDKPHLTAHTIPNIHTPHTTNEMCITQHTRTRNITHNNTKHLTHTTQHHTRNSLQIFELI